MRLIEGSAKSWPEEGKGDSELWGSLLLKSGRSKEGVLYVNRLLFMSDLKGSAERVLLLVILKAALFAAAVEARTCEAEGERGIWSRSVPVVSCEQGLS